MVGVIQQDQIVLTGLQFRLIIMNTVKKPRIYMGLNPGLLEIY